MLFALEPFDLWSSLLPNILSLIQVSYEISSVKLNHFWLFIFHNPIEQAISRGSDHVCFLYVCCLFYLSIFFKKKTKIEPASLVFPESSSERLCTFKHRKRIEFRHYFKLSCVYLTASIYGFRYFSLLLAMKFFMFYSILAPVLAYWGLYKFFYVSLVRCDMLIILCSVIRYGNCYFRFYLKSSLIWLIKCRVTE